MGRHGLARPLVEPEDWQEYLRWREAFHASLDPALYPTDWLDGEVACNRMLLFSSPQSAILVSVKVYPSGLKEVQAELAAGKLGEIRSDLIPRIENWARAHGCRSAQVQSREGWIRVMRAFGYGLYQTTLRKAL